MENHKQIHKALFNKVSKAKEERERRIAYMTAQILLKDVAKQTKRKQ